MYPHDTYSLHCKPTFIRFREVLKEFANVSLSLKFIAICLFLGHVCCKSTRLGRCCKRIIFSFYNIWQNKKINKLAWVIIIIVLNVRIRIHIWKAFTDVL